MIFKDFGLWSNGNTAVPLIVVHMTFVPFIALLTPVKELAALRNWTDFVSS